MTIRRHFRLKHIVIRRDGTRAWNNKTISTLTGKNMDIILVEMFKKHENSKIFENSS